MKRNVVFRRMMALVMACLVMLSMSAVSVFAKGTNSEVQKDTAGIFQIKVFVKGKDNNYEYVQQGTGFLINEETIVTCYHVVSFDSETMQNLKEFFKKKNMEMSENDIKKNMEIRISVLRDVEIKATPKQKSVELDLSILKLEQPIKGRETLTLRHSSEVDQTEDCYALGFPAVVSDNENIRTYTQNDVTITTGKVSKVSDVNDTLDDGTIVTKKCVISSAKIDEGNSGGPLVDGDGYVIGICWGVPGGSDKEYYYSVASDHLIDILDPLGIEYALPGESEQTVEPGQVAESVPASIVETEPTIAAEQPSADKSALQEEISISNQKTQADFTAESFTVFSEALQKAENVNSNLSATQEEVNKAQKELEAARGQLKPKPAISLPLIIGIVAAAVVALILIIVLLTRKKPNTATAPVVTDWSRGGQDINSSLGTSGPGTIPGNIGTSVLAGGGNQTTVLNSGGEGTTVLNSAVAYGELVRKKDGTKISINNDNFKIGRQRSNVDCCIDDNNAIGRVHAVIVNRNGSIYIKDNNSTNGTFVNNVRVKPNAEAPIKTGDKIVLGDEEFSFMAF